MTWTKADVLELWPKRHPEHVVFEYDHGVAVVLTTPATQAAPNPCSAHIIANHFAGYITLEVRNRQGTPELVRRSANPPPDALRHAIAAALFILDSTDDTEPDDYRRRIAELDNQAAREAAQQRRACQTAPDRRYAV